MSSKKANTLANLHPPPFQTAQGDLRPEEDFQLVADYVAHTQAVETQAVEETNSMAEANPEANKHVPEPKADSAAGTTATANT